MESVWPIELLITHFFQALGNWLLLPMQFLSFLGTTQFYMLALPAVYWCFNTALGFRIGTMLVLTGAVNSWFKLAFLSPRPYWYEADVQALSSETSFGMPSGHAQNSTAIFGTIGAGLKRRWAAWTAVGLIVAIGLSRIYLGVHFTSDVLAGWLIGALLLLAALKLDAPLSRWVSRQSLLGQLILITLIAGLIIAVTLPLAGRALNFALPAEWTQNALADGAEAPDPVDVSGAFTLAGIWFGFAGGYAWLHRRGGFDAGGPMDKRILRYLLGVLGVVILYYGPTTFLPHGVDALSFALRFVRYALVGLWTSALAPMLFLRLKLAAPAARVD